MNALQSKGFLITRLNHFGIWGHYVVFLNWIYREYTLFTIFVKEIKIWKKRQLWVIKVSGGNQTETMKPPSSPLWFSFQTFNLKGVPGINSNDFYGEKFISFIFGNEKTESSEKIWFPLRIIFNWRRHPKWKSASDKSTRTTSALSEWNK